MSLFIILPHDEHTDDVSELQHVSQTWVVVVLAWVCGRDTGAVRSDSFVRK